MHRLVRCARDLRCSALIGFLWGLAEGTCFFIIPDLWIGLAAMYSFAGGLAAWGASILGTIVAAVMLWAAVGVGLAPQMLLWSPDVTAPMIARVTARIAAGGLPYDPGFILSGVPFKVYAVVFFAGNGSLAALLPWLLFARLVRIAPTVIVATTLRGIFKNAIEQWYRTWLSLYALFWLVLYIYGMTTRILA